MMLSEMDCNLSYIELFGSTLEWNNLHTSIQTRILSLSGNLSVHELAAIIPIHGELTVDIVDSIIKLPDNDESQLALLELFRLLLDNKITGEILIYLPLSERYSFR